MKKLFIAMLLIMSILIGGCTSTPKFNDWTDSTPGTILITGNISDSDFHKFYNETRHGFDHYTIVLNTNGGEAMACVGIMSRIKELQLQGVKFTTVVYSKAYSAGAFIFATGDDRIMYPGSSLMWHTISGQAKADGRQDWLDTELQHRDLIYTLDNHVIQTMQELHPQVGDRIWNYLLLNSGQSWMFPEAACSLGIATDCPE